MAYNYSVLSHLFQKAIAAQNPGMSRDQRIELRNNKGHELTFQRYHRYAGKCSAKFKSEHFPGPLDLTAVIKLFRTVSLADMLRYLDHLKLKHPELVELLTIGKSSLGQPLKVIKISTGQLTKNGEIKPAIWIDGGEFNRLRLLQCCPALGSYGQFRISLVTRPFLPLNSHSCSTDVRTALSLFSYGPPRVQHAVVSDCQATGS